MAKHGQLDLFGGVKEMPPRKKGRDETFNDYDAYIAKFRDAPHTTDDTFTPPDVFGAVLEWLKGRGKITDETRIVRPFYPGGDFETADYPDGCVVVDNPPFSIFTRCCKWFTARGIPFFLFGPGLTISGITAFCTCIITDTGVRFANGATIPVSFASNMFGGAAAIAAGDLTQMINGCESQRKDTNTARKMAWPGGVVSISDLRKIAAGGGTFELQREYCEIVKHIGGETIYGSAWLSGQYADVAQAVQAAQAARAARAEQAARVVTVLKPSERQTLDRLCALYRQKGGNAPKTGGRNEP